MHRQAYRTALAGLVALVTFANPVVAQLPSARLNSIFPSGGRAGTSVECTIGGTDLDEASGLYFSHPGIKGEPTGPNKFRVSIAPDVPPGPVDVRAVTGRGLSNFRAFCVGDRPEIVETEPDDEPAKAIRAPLPVVINGRIDKANDVDYYVFAARKGQRVIVDCWAWRLDSQLDGTLMVFDPKGRELAYSGDYAGKDPFVDFTAPEDGDYLVKVWDFIYGGSGDLVYRLEVGSLPHLDAALPATVRPGSKAPVTLLGRNLPGGEPTPILSQGRPLETIAREIEVPSVERSLRGGEAIRPSQSWLDGMAYRLTTPEGSSNPIFLGFSDDPAEVEREPNDRRDSAQEIPFPSEVTGTFAPSGDVDFFRFRAPKGEKVVVEVYGERQSGMVDPYLAGYDQTGKRVFAADDVAGRNIGQLRFTTSTHDARWEFVAAADGLFTVQLRDLYYQQRGEARFAYRLSLRRPRPDFRLMAVPTSDIQPDSTTVGRGGRAWLDLLAFRLDNFDGPIRVEVADLPPGVTCDPVVIGPGKASAPLVFRADAGAPPGHAEIRVVGISEVDGVEVRRDARGGGLTWPTVNTPGVARMADSIPIAVREAPPFVVEATPAKARVNPGEKVAIAVRLDRAADWDQPVQVSGFDLPEGATVALVNIPKGSKEARAELSLPAKLRPGPYTFTLNGAGQVPRDYIAKRDPSKPRGNNVRATFPSNPITIDVVPPG